jgi:hypothetical protein
LAKQKGWEWNGQTILDPSPPVAELPSVNRERQAQVLTEESSTRGLVHGDGLKTPSKAILEGLFGEEMVCLGKTKWELQDGFSVRIQLE